MDKKDLKCDFCDGRGWLIQKEFPCPDCDGTTYDYDKLGKFMLSDIDGFLAGKEILDAMKESPERGFVLSDDDDNPNRDTMYYADGKWRLIGDDLQQSFDSPLTAVQALLNTKEIK